MSNDRVVSSFPANDPPYGETRERHVKQRGWEPVVLNKLAIN